MNKWHGWFGALAFCAAAFPAWAGTPATEAQWVAAATHAVAYGQSLGMPVRLEVLSGNGLPGHTPVGMQSENGVCTLVVAARDNPTADKVSAMIEPELLELFLTGAAIHELGHCHRRLHGHPHNEKLLPIVAWIGPVKDWFNRRIRTEEVFADMTEVAWLARYHPDKFIPMLQQLVKVRTRFREPKHDTLAWLEMAMAEGPGDAAENVFVLAGRRMSRYQ